MAAREKLTAHFRIVTPMFLGGAGHEATRIRGASLKGALAFWWRAFYFAGFVQDEDGNGKQALTEMRRRERELFGSSDEGQGRFLLRVSHGELRALKKGKILGKNEEEIDVTHVDLKKTPREAKNTVGVGARYLGYGVIEAFTSRKDSNGPWSPDNIKAYAGRLMRSAFRSDQYFTVDILFRPKATEDDKRQIATALKLLGLLGGLGARVRRGWGSLALERLEGAGWDWQGPQSREEYEAKLQELFEGHPGKSFSGTDWPLTAFAKESGVWLGAAGQGGLAALDTMGRAMLNYRGMGRGDEIAVGGQPILKQFRQDHDWFRMGSNAVDIPYRSAFGLPHMYDSRNGMGVVPTSSDRRASPLLLHVHKAGSTAFAVATLLPTQFLDENIKAVRRNGRNTQRHERRYALTEPYCTRKASGHDVLLDFLGAGPGKFKPNEVLKFEKVLP